MKKLEKLYNQLLIDEYENDENVDKILKESGYDLTKIDNDAIKFENKFKK